jgi:hypothetical protein
MFSRLRALLRGFDTFAFRFRLFIISHSRRERHNLRITKLKTAIPVFCPFASVFDNKLCGGSAWN